MNVIHVNSENLHTNLATGGSLEVLLDVAVGSQHYVWDGNRFVLGEIVGQPKLGVPLVMQIPHLLHLVDMKEKTKGIEPDVYVSAGGLGVGVVYLNVV